MKRNVFLLAAIAMFLLFTPCQEAPASTWEPQNPITVIVNQSAGGGTDAGVRLLMKYSQ